MQKKSFLISLVCAAALVFSSCGGTKKVENECAENEQIEQTEQAEDLAIEVEDVPAMLGVFTFEGKSISQLLGSPIKEVIKVLGEPLGDGTTEDGVIYRLDYDGIHLWFDDGIFVRAEAYNAAVSKLAIDGISLNKNRTELIKAFGKPIKEGREEEMYGNEDAFIMKYRLSNGIVLLEFDKDLNVSPGGIYLQRK